MRPDGTGMTRLTPIDDAQEGGAYAGLTACDGNPSDAPVVGGRRVVRSRLSAGATLRRRRANTDATATIPAPVTTEASGGHGGVRDHRRVDHRPMPVAAIERRSVHGEAALHHSRADNSSPFTRRTSARALPSRGSDSRVVPRYAISADLVRTSSTGGQTGVCQRNTPCPGSPSSNMNCASSACPVVRGVVAPRCDAAVLVALERTANVDLGSMSTCTHVSTSPSASSTRRWCQWSRRSDRQRIRHGTCVRLLQAELVAFDVLHHV